MTIQLTKATYVSGVLAAAGSQHTLDAQTESYLVHIGAATWVDAAYTQGRFEDAKIEYDSDGVAVGVVGRGNEVVGPVWTKDASGNVTGLAGPDGNYPVAPTRPCLMRAVMVGDSMTASAGGNATITALARSGNVATATLAGHGRGTGEICRIYNCLDATYNANAVAVTRIDANSFSYPSIGPDGSTSNLSASLTMQLQSPGWMNDNNYMFWLQSKTGGAMKVAQLAGNNGDDSAGMLARYDTDVISAPDHDMVILLTGYNDFVTNSRTSDAVIANVQAMIAKSHGKLFVAVSAIPWTTGGDAAKRAQAIKYNRALRNYCATQPNVRYADAAQYLIDATNATKFSPLAYMLVADGIHPSPKGAERIAQAIYDAIQYDYLRVSRLVCSSGDNYGADNTNPNYLDAAPWTTSGGAVAGGASGTCAAGVSCIMSGGGTAVASVVARSDGIGYDQQVVFTPSANNDSVTLGGTGYITGRHAVGDALNYLGELSLEGMSGANIKSVDVYITYNGGNALHYVAKAQASSAAYYPASDIVMSLASLVDSVIPSGTTGLGWSIVVKASAAGTAVTIKLGRQSLERVA